MRAMIALGAAPTRLAARRRNSSPTDSSTNDHRHPTLDASAPGRQMICGDRAAESLLLVIDIQERLLPVILNPDRMVVAHTEIA